MKRCGVVALVALFLSGVPFPIDTASAQELGSIEGVVTDAAGNPLPDLEVMAVGLAQGFGKATTDAQGKFVIRELPAGRYNVRPETTWPTYVEIPIVVVSAGQATVIAAVFRSETVPVPGDVSERQIDALPTASRDINDFARLVPNAKSKPQRIGLSLSGQRAVNSGLQLDGSEGKSAFFGYGRGSEITENDGLVVSQDSVKEFQVITNGFAVEYGSNGGGFVNVITKSGTNDFHGNVFFYHRNDSLNAKLPLSRLDEARGNTCRENGGTVPCAPEKFRRATFGATLGGPIDRDQTYFFVSFDQTRRNTPFLDSIFTPGVYDAVRSRVPDFVQGYTANGDGTATGSFRRLVSNRTFFGKVDHQLTTAHQLTLRINYTDYLATSTRPNDDASRPATIKFGQARVASQFGSRAFNVFRLLAGLDNVDRLGSFERERFPRQAFSLRFDVGGQTTLLGKPDFLPFNARESTSEVKNDFWYFLGAHKLTVGMSAERSRMSLFSAQVADGLYQFTSVASFPNTPATFSALYGNVSNPNFEASVTSIAGYAGDTWSIRPNLTLNAGLRWEGQFNPQGLAHVFDGTVTSVDGARPNATNIPNDLNNIAPRLGFWYRPGRSGRTVLRGGAGLFYSRTPALLYSTGATQNGLLPNLGVVTIGPNSPGFVPLGQPINNALPPPGVRPNVAFVDPDFENPATWRFNLGYEREILRNWLAGIDLVYAHTTNLHSNDDLNRAVQSHDAFGRPIYSAARPNPAFRQILTRSSVGYSDYSAATFSINKRFSDGYQIAAHYTYSIDKDTDSNERALTAITISDVEDVDYDYGFSDRDIRHRFVLSGLAELPRDFKLSGALFAQSGTPFTALDAASGVQRDPNGPFAPRPRAIVNGALADRNGERSDPFFTVDLRLSKVFRIGDGEVEAFGEVFNALNTNTFNVGQATSQALPLLANGAPNPEFGLGNTLLSRQREFQLGARIRF